MLGAFFVLFSYRICFIKRIKKAYLAHYGKKEYNLLCALLALREKITLHTMEDAYGN